MARMKWRERTCLAASRRAACTLEPEWIARSAFEKMGEEA